MCGIVGVIAKAHNGFWGKQVDIFKQMLYADVLRGDDATGVIYVDNKANFATLKEASPAHWCLDTIMDDDLLKAKMTSGKALIGHNRKATIGKVTDETSHPFVVDNKFAMVHNGTLRNHKSLKDTVVDSEALAHHLSSVFVKDVEKEKLEEEVGKVDGAYAVVAYNQESDTIYLMRNNERPLYIIETSAEFIFASEPGLVWWIAGRNSIDVQKAEGYFLKEHELWEINLVNNKVTKTEFSPKKATPPVTHVTRNTGGTASKSTSNIQARAGDISKGRYKQIKNRFLGQRHTFYVDDWVEKHFPHKSLDDGTEDTLLLMGEFDGEVFAGVDAPIVAEVNIEKVYGEDIPEDPSDLMYHGIIEDVRYERDKKSVTFIVSDVKVMTQSNVAKAASNVVALTSSKWSATESIKGNNNPPWIDLPPENMGTELWRNACNTHYFDETTKKWKLKNETSTTVH